MTQPSPTLIDLVAGRPTSSPNMKIAALAIEHRLGGQLLRKVNAGAISVSPDDHRTLTAADIATAAHHEQLWRGATSAIDSLADVDIQAFIIKGVAEEARWYATLGDRPCSDVDVLIAPGSVDRVDVVLDTLCPDYPAREAAVSLVRGRQLQHVHFVREGVAIDVHFDPLKLGTWVRRADLVTEGATCVVGPAGAVLPVLAPELALVSFLTHLNKDGFAYLGAYGDVVRVLERPGLDWDRFDRFVASEGLEVPVQQSIAAVSKTLQIELSRPLVTGPRARAWNLLWPESSRLRGHDGRKTMRYRQRLIPLLMTGRRSDVVRELGRQLFPPAALLDIHRPELTGRRRLRHLSLDRFLGRAAGS